ncbi:MAG: alpha/beta fold hydrolase [Aquabacterium sp.]
MNHVVNPATETQEAHWHALVNRIDQHVQGRIGQMVGGISPLQASLVYLDWLGHLMASPGKQLDIARGLLGDSQAAMLKLSSAPREVEAADGQYKRFASPGWAQWPYVAFAEGFRVLERAWESATHGVPGLNHRNEEAAAFAARQWLDVLCPANLPWLNPDVLKATQEEHGANLMRGAMNWLDDLHRMVHKLPPAGVEAYQVGKDVAITPGKVVYRNDLIELIQYSPATDKVYAEPVLIVPAWIMKYYILDLSPHNSLVKYLVEHGHTVFMISWKNPGTEDRDKGMEDYRVHGVMAALDTVCQIVPDRKVHGVGYCLGGTMLQIAAATMGREKDERLASMTLLAAQGDFSEAGELLLFINEAEVNLLEAIMAEQGYLRGSQMAGAFTLLHSNDLIWSRALKHYMLGVRDLPNDLMSWNADATRMPARMHSEYLHKLFLNNDLATGRYEVDGQPIWFTDIHVPCFAVGTVSDHVAPWKSVYKLHLLPLDVTFVLTSGGHNAGIISEPGHPRRHFQLQHRPASDRYIAPEVWQQQAPTQEGSWWPSWQNWLAGHSSGKVAPPRMGLPGKKGQKLADAPGSYVLMR